jgi:hypothetical protein
MDELVDKNSTFGVPRRREEVIEILNACYSSDLLELAEFERRVERANAALTIGDLESVVADVPEAFRACQLHGSPRRGRFPWRKRSRSAAPRGPSTAPSS